MQNLIQKLEECRKTLPRKQRALCDYILNNLYEAGAMNITELAEKAGVGNTTVMRILQPLGYESFLQFKSDLRDLAIKQNNSYVNAVAMQMEKLGSSDPEAGLSTKLDAFSRAILQMETEEYSRALTKAVDVITGSRMVYTFGSRTSASFAAHMMLMLKTIGIHARDLSARPDYAVDNLIDIGPEDCVILIMSYPAAETTIRVAEILCERKIPLILIADKMAAGAFTEQTVFLDIQTEYEFTAATKIIVTIEMIRIETNRRKPELLKQYLEKTDQFMEQFGFLERTLHQK